MTLVAKKDTYGLERVSADNEVRRVVKAGQVVPDHYELEDPDAVEEVDAPNRMGTPTDYLHKQLGKTHAEAREAAGFTDVDEQESEQRERAARTQRRRQRNAESGSEGSGSE